MSSRKQPRFIQSIRNPNHNHTLSFRISLASSRRDRRRSKRFQRIRDSFGLPRVQQGQWIPPMPTTTPNLPTPLLSYRRFVDPFISLYYHILWLTSSLALNFIYLPLPLTLASPLFKGVWLGDWMLISWGLSIPIQLEILIPLFHHSF